MRLREFILEFKGPQGGRGKTITREEAVDTIKTKCKKALAEYQKTGKTLYRGAKNNQYYVVDPKSSPRRSQYTENYYTLILDNDPRWKKFPKRSEALICTTNRYKANSYGGTVNRVFAFDGANYGVAPNDDIWESFKETLPSGTMLGEVNDFITFAGEYFDINIKNTKTFQKFMGNIDILAAEMEMFADKYQQDEIDAWDKNFEYYDLFQKWEYRGYPPFKKFILDIFAPNKNHFLATKDIGRVFTHGLANKEVWTDSKAVLIAEYTNMDGMFD